MATFRVPSEFSTIQAALDAAATSADANDLVIIEAAFATAEGAVVAVDGVTVQGDTAATGIALTLGAGVTGVTLTGITPIAVTAAEGVQTLNGNAGANTLDGGAGDDVLNGNGGSDTAAFAGARADYTISYLDADSVQITGADGTDIANGVERFQFSDGTTSFAGLINGTNTGPSFGGLAPVVVDDFFGESDGDFFGRAIAGVGDLNGDGRADFVVGAFFDDTAAGENSGSVRAISGANGSTLFTAAGDSVGDNFGRSVAGVGDVNGDGRPDLIVGAPSEDEGFTNSGGARVISGVNGSTLFTIRGDSAQDQLGLSVAGAGDVNGDGTPDLIVGAPDDDNNSLSGNGSARVVSGADQSVLFTLVGDGAFDSFGASVAGAGDVNGDGRADLIVGANRDDSDGLNNNGSARVISGMDGSTLFTFFGAGENDQFGTAVAGAGDVNGDGLADLVVGVGQADSNGLADSGSVRVFSGADGSMLFNLTGARAGERFGFSVAGAGDVDGDGRADLIVGAPGNLSVPGTAQVISGRDGRTLFTLEGDPESGAFGLSVAGAGDVNGDGRADVIVGDQTYSSPGMANNGIARVVTGVEADLDATPILVISEGTPVVLDGTAVLFDAELERADSYAGSTLTLSRQGGASADDVFGATAELALIGSDVVLGGVTVGTFTQSEGVLAISFNAAATSARADAVLQRLTYSNTAAEPPAFVTVDLVFNDGNTGDQGVGGARSATGSITVGITATPPVTDSGTAGDDILTFNASDGDSGSYTRPGDGSAQTVERTGFVFNGGAGDDIFILQNPLGGLFGPAGGVTFNGEGGADELQITGGNATSAVFNYTNPNDGSVVLSNGSQTGAYNYTGLEPVLMDSDTAPETATFNLPAGDDTVALAPTADPGDGDLLLLDSVDGTFEDTTFNDPTGLVAINGGDGDLIVQGVTRAGKDVAISTADVLTISGTMTARDITLTAATFGVGSLTDALLQEGGDLTVTATGGDLTLGGLSAANNLAVAASGTLSLGGVLSAAAAVTASAGNLLLQGAGSIQASGDLVTLNAEDGVTLETGAVVEAGSLVINLDTGAADAGGVTATLDADINAASITVNGGAENDTVTLAAGETSAATLNGGAGDDSLTGGGGGDTLNGEGGDDRMVFAENAGAASGGAGTDTLVLSVNDGAGVFTRPAFEDADNEINIGLAAGAEGFSGYMDGAGTPNLSFSGVDRFEFTNSAATGRDIIFGGGLDDAISTGGGNDLLVGGAGADTLTGGDGTDTASYRSAAAGVTLDFSGGAFAGTGDAAGDSFTEIEDLEGSEFDDIFRGNDSVAVDEMVNGRGGNDQLFGRGGADTLRGDEGDDLLDGGGAADLLDGGDGIDTVSYASSGAAVNLTITNGELIDGGEGSGDSAGDSYDSIEIVALTDFAESVTLTGGGMTIRGQGGADQLILTEGASRLEGGTGDDTLRAQEQSDAINQGVLVGGLGDDSYVIGTGAHQVIEAADEGTDTVSVESGSYVLTANVENLFGADDDATLRGNALGNQIVGGGGADTVDGNEGNDILTGGLGQDTVTGEGGDDEINVAAGEIEAGEVNDGGDGTDELYVSGAVDFTGTTLRSFEILGFGVSLGSSATFTSDQLGEQGEAGSGEVGLSDTLLVEGDGTANMIVINTVAADRSVDLSGWTFQDWSDTDGVGGPGPDTITINGSDGSDSLTGSSRRDTINAGVDNDLVNGGDGLDTLDGGAGTDALDYTGDGSGVIVNLADSTSSADTISGFENVFGGAFGDTLTGDGAENDLDGGGGDDTLDGAGGGDGLSGGDGNDRIIAGLGDDLVMGGAGIDTLDFSGFADGGAGVGVTVNLALSDAQNTGEGSDTIIEVEHLIGSAFGDTLTGSGDANRIDGGAGVDTMTGGLGDDIYVVDEAADVVIEATGEGTDRIDTNLQSYRLGADDFVENLLGGAADQSLIGTGLNNAILGGDGDDVLQGLEGDDTLDGGAGDDTASYSEAAAGVTVSLLNSGFQQNTEGAGADTLSAIENLEGSSFNDVLTGNGDNPNDFGTARVGFGPGANTLRGFGGDDTLIGGFAADLLEGGADDDLIRGGGGANTLDGGDGIDTVSYEDLIGLKTGPVSVELDLAAGTAEHTDDESGTDSLEGFENATGSSGDDILRGDEAANVLSGLAGADLLEGRDGDDSLRGGAGNDTLDGGLNDDVLEGGEGDDTLTGGDGLDTASYAGAGVGVTVDLREDAPQTTGVGSDTLSGVENLLGSANDDDLTGDGGANVLDGEDGDDTLFGDAGDDVLDGDAGADRLIGGLGDDDAFGGVGGDVMIGEAGDDYLVGGEDDDTLLGDADEDLLLGGAGLDYLSGGSENDRLFGDAGADILLGEDGDDLLQGGADDDQLQGGAGADRLNGETGRDYLVGGEGNDVLHDEDGDDTLIGDAGDDYLSAGAGADTLLGGDGLDTLVGEDGDDIAYGGADADTVSGESGRDVLLGETGDDYLVGDGGNDFLFGEDGADTLLGEADDDYLDGGAGADMIQGGSGMDLILGEAGDDVLFGEADNDQLYGGDGLDVLIGGDGNDYVAGGAEADSVDGGAGTDVLVGETGNDLLLGGADNDQLDGGADDDQLQGGDGDDILTGSVGNDLLAGGRGVDQLYGGEGADRFVFASLEDSSMSATDEVYDFIRNEDVIDLTGIDADLGAAGDQAFRFVDAFTGAGGEATLVFDSTAGTSLLRLDLDGDSQADFQLIINGDPGRDLGIAL